MAEVVLLNGFFHIVGHSEYPLGTGRNQKFGFDVGGSAAKFKYSINDVEAVFTDSREMTRSVSSSISANQISSLMFNKGTIIPDLYDSDKLMSNEGEVLRNYIMTILEYAFNNRASAASPTGQPGYTSTGDWHIQNELFPVGAQSLYVPKSLSLVLSNRIDFSTDFQYIEFKVIATGICAPNHDLMIRAYIIPDHFIELDVNFRHEIYVYEDEDDNEIISPTEFSNQIINKHLDIFTSNRGLRSVTSVTVNKRTIGTNETIAETFYIYTSYDKTSSEFAALNTSDMRKKNLLKAYLNDLYDNNLTTLRALYPDLYPTDTVAMFYLGSVKYYANSNRDEHPLHIGALQTKLTTKGFGPTYFSRSNIFMVGDNAHNEWETTHPSLMIAFDNTAGGQTTATPPISSKFPDFVPLFGEANNSSVALSLNTRTFHSLLVNVLACIENGSISSLDTTTINSYSVVYVHSANKSERKVTFQYDGTIYEVQYL